MSSNNGQGKRIHVEDLYPILWVTPDDLKGRQVDVVIKAVTQEPIYNNRTKKDDQRFVVAFPKTEKRFILNKTQSYAITELVGSGFIDDWVGHRIGMAPGIAPNNKATIDIVRPKPTAADHAPTIAEPEAEGDVTDYVGGREDLPSPGDYTETEYPESDIPE